MSGVATALVLSELNWKVLPKFLPSAQGPFPARKFLRWIRRPKDRLCYRDHRRSCVKNPLRCLQGDAGRGTQHHVLTSLLPEMANSIDSDGPLVRMLGSRLEDRPDRKVVRWSFENSRQKIVATTERAHDPICTNQSPRLRRREIPSVDMHSIKLRLLNKICPVI